MCGPVLRTKWSFLLRLNGCSFSFIDATKDRLLWARAESSIPLVLRAVCWNRNCRPYYSMYVISEP